MSDAITTTTATTVHQLTGQSPEARKAARLLGRGAARGASGIRGASAGASGSQVHSKNRTWVAGRGSSANSSPAPEGKWERGRGRGGVRGGRGRGRGRGGGEGGSGFASANVTEDEGGESDVGGVGEQADYAFSTNSSFAMAPALGPPPASAPPLTMTTSPSMNSVTKTWEEVHALISIFVMHY